MTSFAVLLVAMLERCFFCSKHSWYSSPRYCYCCNSFFHSCIFPSSSSSISSSSNMYCFEIKHEIKSRCAKLEQQLPFLGVLLKREQDLALTLRRLSASGKLKAGFRS
jgi:hypothetical protein